jgi:hypothetical protein
MLVYKNKYGEEVELNKEVARKVLAIVDKGLTIGMGKPTPGFMCVEAAVCLAMGMEHGDDPSCVGYDVSEAKIILNDNSGWSSKKARAHGMRAIALAQLGSDTVVGFNECLRKVIVKSLLIPAIKAAGWPTNRITAIKNDHFTLNANDTSALHDIVYDIVYDGTTAEDLVTSAIILAKVKGEVTDKSLTVVANCILAALKLAKSPGVKFLSLLKETA